MHDNLKSTNYFFFKKKFIYQNLYYLLLLFFIFEKINTNNIKKIKYELIENEY